MNAELMMAELRGLRAVVAEQREEIAKLNEAVETYRLFGRDLLMFPYSDIPGNRETMYLQVVDDILRDKLLPRRPYSHMAQIHEQKSCGVCTAECESSTVCVFHRDRKWDSWYPQIIVEQVLNGAVLGGSKEPRATFVLLCSCFRKKEDACQEDQAEVSEAHEDRA